jgi:osmotically-inducible protein OsmY
MAGHSAIAAPTDSTGKGTTVNKFKINAIAIAIGLAFSAGATAQSMSKADYQSAKDSIAAEYKSAKAGCESMSGNAEDICKAEAKGKENVAKAELEARHAPSNKNRHAVSIAKAKADYSVAKEKCDDKNGNDKMVCVKEAKAAETSAMADAKAELKSADASKPAKETSTVSTSKKEGPKEYVKDSVITAKVKAELAEEKMSSMVHISVNTDKMGAVSLSGTVRTQADMDKAASIARGVKGVTSVQNNIQIKADQ